MDTAPITDLDVVWTDICDIRDLAPNSGICALVGDQQVAVFYLPTENIICAISNYDPIGKANVLSRGIVGDIQGEIVVASPLYKQHFSLTTGRCLEIKEASVTVFPTRLSGKTVQIGYPPSSGAAS